MTILIGSPGRGTIEIERYIMDDGESSIMINQTAATPNTIHLALDAEEARKLAAALIDFANQEEGNNIT